MCGSRSQDRHCFCWSHSFSNQSLIALVNGLCPSLDEWFLAKAGADCLQLYDRVLHRRLRRYNRVLPGGGGGRSSWPSSSGRTPAAAAAAAVNSSLNGTGSDGVASGIYRPRSGRRRPENMTNDDAPGSGRPIDGRWSRN